MYCKKLTEEELTKTYHTYMKQDFPASELKPLNHILRSMEEGFGFTLGIYGEEELEGYAVFILCEETRCALLDYFAILKDKRGGGLRHCAFALMETYMKENLPWIEALYIESERVSAAEDEKQRRIRERRIAFYLSCGCEMTALRSVLFGVEYSVLYKPFGKHTREEGVERTEETGLEQIAGAGAERGHRPSREALDALYKKMFKPEHYARCVSLTD